MAMDVSTKRAVGYFRVSTAEQAGERHSSLEIQKARFQEITALGFRPCL